MKSLLFLACGICLYLSIIYIMTIPKLINAITKQISSAPTVSTLHTAIILIILTLIVAIICGIAGFKTK